MNDVQKESTSGTMRVSVQFLDAPLEEKGERVVMLRRKRARDDCEVK